MINRRRLVREKRIHKVEPQLGLVNTQVCDGGNVFRNMSKPFKPFNSTEKRTFKRGDKLQVLQYNVKLLPERKIFIEYNNSTDMAMGIVTEDAISDILKDYNDNKIKETGNSFMDDLFEAASNGDSNSMSFTKPITDTVIVSKVDELLGAGKIDKMSITTHIERSFGVDEESGDTQDYIHIVRCVNVNKADGSSFTAPATTDITRVISVIPSISKVNVTYTNKHIDAFESVATMMMPDYEADIRSYNGEYVGNLSETDDIVVSIRKAIVTNYKKNSKDISHLIKQTFNGAGRLLSVETDEYDSDEDKLISKYAASIDYLLDGMSIKLTVLQYTETGVSKVVTDYSYSYKWNTKIPSVLDEYTEFKSEGEGPAEHVKALMKILNDYLAVSQAAPDEISVYNVITTVTVYGMEKGVFNPDELKPNKVYREGMVWGVLHGLHAPIVLGVIDRLPEVTEDGIVIKDVTRLVQTIYHADNMSVDIIRRNSIPAYYLTEDRERIAVFTGSKSLLTRIIETIIPPYDTSIQWLSDTLPLMQLVHDDRDKSNILQSAMMSVMMESGKTSFVPDEHVIYVTKYNYTQYVSVNTMGTNFAGGSFVYLPTAFKSTTTGELGKFKSSMTNATADTHWDGGTKTSAMIYDTSIEKVNSKDENAVVSHSKVNVATPNKYINKGYLDGEMSEIFDGMLISQSVFRISKEQGVSEYDISQSLTIAKDFTLKRGEKLYHSERMLSEVSIENNMQRRFLASVDSLINKHGDGVSLKGDDYIQTNKDVKRMVKVSV